MANNQYVNKVVYGTTVLVDLTADTVTAEDLALGVTAHDASGAAISGTVLPKTKHRATITNDAGASASSDFARIDRVGGDTSAVYYKDGSEFVFEDGDTFRCYAVGKRADTGYLYVNNVRVAGSTLGLSYTYTPPACDLEIRLKAGDGASYVYITYPSIAITANGTYDVSDYAEAVVDVSGGANMQSKTATPTTSQQTITPDSGYDGLSSVTVAAMPTGTAGTPTATKGTVSNHSVAVTPSVTNTTGYISGGTKTGTAVTVSASELVSGSQTLTDNGTVNVTNLASVTVDIDFVTYHTSSSAPTSSQGSNGDIWLVTA